MRLLDSEMDRKQVERPPWEAVVPAAKRSKASESLPSRASAGKNSESSPTPLLRLPQLPFRLSPTGACLKDWENSESGPLLGAYVERRRGKERHGTETRSIEVSPRVDLRLSRVQELEAPIRFKGKKEVQSAVEGCKPGKRRPKPVLVLKLDPSQLASIYTILAHEFCLGLCRSNGVLPALPCDTTYKVFIGPGNNSHLVAHLVKRRWFWTRVDSWQPADLVWTQHRSRAVTQSLPCSAATPTVSTLSEVRLPALLDGKKSSKAIVDTEREKSGVTLVSAVSVTLIPMPASASLRVYNRIERNYHLTTKRRLFLNMRSYYAAAGVDVFSYLPLTFLITEGKNDPEFARFRQCFSENEAETGENKPKSHNLWIIKPGENTNCGHGIHVSSSFSEIESLISSSAPKRSVIVQKYLEKPLLVHKRKFDIRCYGLCTSFNGHIQGYFYHDGYLRTSSKEFSLRNVGNRFIHLTNDAVQKKSEDYGKFESGNKMSYAEFQRYLETNLPGKGSFWTDLWPQIRQLVTDSFRATHKQLDPRQRQHSFEVLGYDFMVDEDFRVWLIEVNTNPCLELSSAYLAGLIPAMLDNALRIAVDPYFPEPLGKRQNQWSAQVFQNRFELVFSSTERLRTAEGGENSYLSEGEEA